jgi:hypothetical protein
VNDDDVVCQQWRGQNFAEEDVFSSNVPRTYTNEIEKLELLHITRHAIKERNGSKNNLTKNADVNAPAEFMF